jgi:PTS system cellobiose-specific IIC component
MDIQNLTDKGQVIASKIQQNRYMSAISNGLASLLPLMVIGAFSSLLASMQIGNYQQWIAPIQSYISLPSMFTTSMLSIYAVFMISSRLAQTFDMDGIIPGIVSLLAFLIVTPLSTFEGERGPVFALSFSWLGPEGLFAAIIIALITCRLYVWIVKRDMVIKMPDSVPPTISRSFVGLIPAVVISILFVIIYAIFERTQFGSLHQMVYSVLQLPLQGLGNSIWSMLFAVFLMQLLWILGIHGAIVVMSVMTPIWTALDLENLEAFRAGIERPNIIPGMTVYSMLPPMIGFVLVMLFFTKSKELKTIAKLGAPGTLFGIHEPLMFGVPFVLNPILAVPYIITPLFCLLAGYIFILMGMLPVGYGITVPFGTPIILQGLLAGSWRFAVMQVALIPVCMLIYYPFVRILDKQKLAMEQDKEKNENEKVVGDRVGENEEIPTIDSGAKA